MVRRGTGIIATAALVVAFLCPTDVLAQAGSCGEFKATLARRLDMLLDARQHLDQDQKKLAEVNILDPRLNREVYGRELKRICELARTMIVVAQSGEKLMSENEARCPAEHFELGARGLAETTLDYELARQVLANEKLCK